jgi:hypothetical protein
MEASNEFEASILFQPLNLQHSALRERLPERAIPTAVGSISASNVGTGQSVT